MTRIREEFRRQWDAIGDHSVFNEAYTEWKARPRGTSEAQQPPYKLLWGGGCPSTPLTAEEFWAWHQRFGWPSDAEVFDENGEDFVVYPDKGQSFDTTSRLWGSGRAARNNPRSSVPSAAQFDLIEAGMNNFIESLTRSVADAGDVMLVIEGQELSTAGARVVKCAVLLTGTSYSPKLFDVTPCVGEDGNRFLPASVGMPALVKITSTPCRAAERFTGIGYETSDELVLLLVNTFATMVLYRAHHEVADVGDGTLRWSRLHSLELVGMLWSPACGARCSEANAGVVAWPTQKRP